MALYTLVTMGGRRHVATVDFKDDAAVIPAAGEVLTPKHTSIAVGRGCGQELAFLGAWDRGAGGVARWTAED